MGIIDEPVFHLREYTDGKQSYKIHLTSLAIKEIQVNAHENSLPNYKNKQNFKTNDNVNCSFGCREEDGWLMCFIKKEKNDEATLK